MSSSYLKDQTLAVRRMIAGASEPLKAKADHIPPTWSNNLRWHLGHLVVTPRLLTYGLFKEPLGVDEKYRAWFAKGSSPANWKGGDELPSVDHLVGEIVVSIDELFDAMAPRLDTAYPEAYTTSVGVVLTNPREALSFSLMHDGIHLGLLLALRRALNAA